MSGKKKYDSIISLEQLKDDKDLYKKVLKVAQFEAEVDMGVNPKNTDQADVSNLTKTDFDYIRRVGRLVETLLNDTDWLVRTINEIKNRFKARPETTKGVRFDDELFKGGRGILEDYLKETGDH